MKKYKKILFVLIFSFLLIMSTACGKKVDYESKDYVLEMEYKDDFKILQLTDIHIANKDDRKREYKFLKETIDRANADLIVITGDSFTFATRRVAKEFFEFFDSCKTPWTITWGNHDEQCYFSIDWLTRKLNKLSDDENSYCIFKDLQDDNVNGNANFAINLMNGEKISTQLILMDSNRYNYGDYIGYDYFRDNQIKWYCDLVDYTTEQNGGEIVPSLMFFHIPLPEWSDAWDAYEKGEAELIIGDKTEGFAFPKYNSGFFDKILEKSSTIGIFVGHDHLNDFILKYKGIYLGYGVTATDRIYFDEAMLGGTVITIHNDNTLGFDLIVRSYEEYE